MRLHTAIILAFAFFPVVATAAPVSLPDDAARAVVRIVCEDRQGSGAVTDAAEGYVVTAGHLPIDPETRVQTDTCSVGFIDDTGRIATQYRATVERATFNGRTERDFAVLKIGQHVAGPPRPPSAQIRTNEFSWIGDVISAYGFPGGSNQLQAVTGNIMEFSRGLVRTDAAIEGGYSGGPVLDSLGNLIGIATRFIFTTDGAGTQVPSHYEMGDVVSLINWIDEASVGTHDIYLTHNDQARFDGAPYVIREESSPCTDVAVLVGTSTVSCLLEGDARLVFPNLATFLSWYPDFSGVFQISAEGLANYNLIGNVTMRPGTLVKIQTDFKTYLVTDSFGTLRWVPSEERARALFGDGWASMVRDVPDVFFTDYREVAPIQ